MRIIVAGMAAAYPLGGVFWDYVQYVIGFHELGYDVFYVEDTGRWCYDTELQTMVKEGGSSARWIARQVAQCAPELQDRWFFRDAAGQTYGASLADVTAFAGTADLFLNVSAASKLNSAYIGNARLAFIDSDPMYTQALLPAATNGTLNRLARRRYELMQTHDAYFTFGENIGRHGCLVPTGGFDWLPTRQPIAMDRLNAYRIPPKARCRKLTTVASWERYSKPIVVDGVKYHGKSREFRKYFDFPRQTSIPTEVALAGKAPRETMVARGWHLVEPGPISQTADDYMRYLADSFAEWSVAKHAYVASKSGWFSGRSACYLALGVPVVLQDTGFSSVLPTGEGLFAFSTVDQAVEAIEAIASNYQRHCKAAHEIAEEYFDSRKVLTKLLDDAFATQPVSNKLSAPLSAGV